MENIIALRKEQGVKQEVIAQALGFTVTNWSRYESGIQELKVSQLTEIASCFKDISVIDLITYPDKYVKQTENQHDKVSVTFEVSPDNRDQLIELITKKTK